MLDFLGDATFAAVIGMLGGILLGLAARLGRFCTLGAIEDFLYGGNGLRLRMWILAIGFSICGSFGLMAAGFFDPSTSFYLSLHWSPMASIIGGGLFGYGMALAGACGYGALARLGGGDIRSFVIVLVMGIAAYATVSGPIAWGRVALFPSIPAEGVQNGIAHLIASSTGVSVYIIGFLIGLFICILAFIGGQLTRKPKSILWAFIVSLAVICAWGGMQYIHDNGFDDLPVVSHTFSTPIGETILYGMTATGQKLSFGVGSVIGVILGAFLGSLIKGQFRWEACEDPRELRRQIIGAATMGIGAVIALGCSIGQGLSAFSILAYSAPVTFVAIFMGAAIGLRQLIVGFSPAK